MFVKTPNSDFFGSMGGREKKKRAFKLLSSIRGVSPVGIRQAKSESSSSQRGLRVCTKNEGFH